MSVLYVFLSNEQVIGRGEKLAVFCFSQVETALLNRDMVYYNAFIEWMQLHPMKFLLIAVIVFMVITCALSAVRDDQDD